MLLFPRNSIIPYHLSFPFLMLILDARSSPTGTPLSQRPTPLACPQLPLRCSSSSPSSLVDSLSLLNSQVSSPGYCPETEPTPPAPLINRASLPWSISSLANSRSDIWIHPAGTIHGSAAPILAARLRKAGAALPVNTMQR